VGRAAVSHPEKVGHQEKGGRMSGFTGLKIPHPSLRDTLSRREREARQPEFDRKLNPQFGQI